MSHKKITKSTQPESGSDSTNRLSLPYETGAFTGNSDGARSPNLSEESYPSGSQRSSSYSPPQKSSPVAKAIRTHSRTASGVRVDDVSAVVTEQMGMVTIDERPATTINSTVGKHFEVAEPSGRICKHSISYFTTTSQKQVKNRALKRQLLQKVLERHLINSGGTKPIVDGTDAVYSKNPLHSGLQAAPSEMFFDITHQPKSSEEGTNFRIRVLRQPDVKFDNLAKSLQNCECSGTSECAAQDCVHTLNILLRSVLSQSEGWFCVNKNLWLSKEAMSIDAKVKTSQHVKLHDGMTFSIDLVEKKCGSPSGRKLMLTVSPRPTPFVEACNLGVFYADYIDNFQEDAVDKVKALRSFVKRLEVTQAYKPSRDDGVPRIIRAPQNPGDLPQNARRRQIVSLGQSATEQKFKLDEAGMATEEISVSCYFEQYYGYKLRFPNLPVVNVGDSAKKIWIPMELLWVKEQPVFKFPPLQMKDGFKSIHMKCEESIRNFDANLSDKHSKVVKLLNPTLLKDAFGITFKSEAENITAYFVDSPPEGPREQQGHVKDKRFKAPKFAGSPQMVRFLALKSGSERHTVKEQEVFEEACKKLLVAFRTEGGLCDEPKAAYDYDTFQSVLGAGDNAESPLKRFSPKSKMLLLISLDGTKEIQADAQARIRCWCDKNNVPAVFFDVQKFQENMKHWERSEKGTNVPEIRQAVGYARALITKAVHRCAGQVPSTQEINPADREDLKKLLKETMVVGASLTSGQSDPSDDLPSIAAVTTSLGDDFVQYQGRFRLQNSGQKTIANLSDMLKEMLSEYAQAHGNRLPESILYLREGISKNHFHLIRNDEIRKIADAFNELCTQKPQLVVSNAAPNITFIALSKRAKPRFFPDGDRIAQLTPKNLKEGIVVDAMDIQAMTAKEREFDFHLQSHSNSCDSAKQCGFISNTHYYVLKHENRWSQEEVERIMDRLCRTNAIPAATSYVAPVHYSGKICERVRVYLRACAPADRAALPDEEVIRRIEKCDTWPEAHVLGKTMFWL